MNEPFRTTAVFLAAWALLNLGGTGQSATPAAEAKGLRGWVCDDSGKPVLNAKVAVNYHPLETDRQGRFFLPHEKLKYERTAFVTVETTFENKERNPPYRWEVVYARVLDYVTGQENVTVRPRIPGVLGGRVLSVAGKPIAGASVAAHINVGELVCTGLHQVREPVQTDPQGRFRIPRLYPDNDYQVRVEVPGYERKWTGWLHVRSGEPARVDIRLREAPAFVAGKVVDAQGRPLAETRVVLGHLCCADAVTNTDTEGNFRIESLLPEQEVVLWVNGTTVKTKAGTDHLRIVAPPKL
jgi:hypothetical protein